MTQYMLTVHTVEGEPVRTPEEAQPIYEQVNELNQEMQGAGVWVFGGGLEPADTATVVSHQGTDILLTDGPFVEGKEHIGGFWVIEAADLDAALAWASKATVACQGPVEVRPFQPEPQP